MQHSRFTDRYDAGKWLAKALARYDSEDAVVYALPRGGAPLGAAVAAELELPLSLIVSRKIGHPENPEYAVCAVTDDGALACNEEESTKLDPAWLTAAIGREQHAARQQRRTYGFARLPATGRIAIIIDDGIATGLTMRAAIQSLRRELPIEVVAASPIAPRAVAEYLRKDADEVIVLNDSEPFLGAIESYYESFEPVTDEEVMRILADYREQPWAEEPAVPSRLLNRTEKPTRPPGKVRAGAKEDYRHLHRK